jgi:hypothetical protein
MIPSVRWAEPGSPTPLDATKAPHGRSPMRCTRCDRPAVPQAVARTRGGLVVFGWCLDCLEAEGCVHIEVASKARRRKSDGPERPRGTIRPSAPGESRGRMRIQWTIAALLGAWSLVLLSAGAWSAWRPGAGSASPLGNGTTVLFLVGGLVSGLIGLVFAITAFDPPRRVGAALRAVELVSFLLAVIVMVASILAFDPRRNIGMLAVVVLLLGISVSATRLRRSRQFPGARPSRDQAKRVGGNAASLEVEEDVDLEGL